LSGADLSGADLNGANLREINLSGATLTGIHLNEAQLDAADLTDAKLHGAKMIGAHLSGADLSGAKMVDVDLSKKKGSEEGSDLRKAILRETVLIDANLSEACLNGADLSGADLSGADLSGAKLIGAPLNETKLGDAFLMKADMANVVFQPKPNALPHIPFFATAKNLSAMKFENLPHGLVELREAFKKGGFRKQEREITYAIKHTERHKLWDDKESTLWNKAESVFYYIFFEITCQYGMNPGRPLVLLIPLIIIFAIPYTIVLKISPRKDGIWKAWIPERARKDLGAKDPYLLNHINLKLYSALGFGFYFSILSAFSIGWRELNVGNWIARIQRREYILRATGWVRTVSGIQSLISVYFVGLWVLSYFGRPFEAM
jgi:hypothetical protein